MVARLAPRSLRVCLGIVLGVLLARPVVAADPPPTPCSKAIREQFSKWDLDGDGKLTIAEINEGVRNPRIKGDAAAALATLKNIEINHTDEGKEPPPYTLALLKKYERAKAANKDVPYQLDDWFQEYKSKIERTSRDLFPQRRPQLTSIKQGDLGDCYFLSALGKVVYRDPDGVQKMISTNPDGGYKVQFPGADKPVKVPRPTDAEIAFNTTAGKNGIWLTVMELAYAKVENRQRKKGDRKKVATDNIAYGGSSRGTITLLTGHAIVEIHWRNPQMHQALTLGGAAKCLMTTGVREEVKSPAGIHSGHSYAILEYDAAKRLVTMFDSEGGDFTPEGKPGLVNGYPRKDGVFTIPLAEFLRISDGVFIENKDAAAQFKGAD